MAGDKLTFHPRDEIGQELIARLTALEQENNRLREIVERAFRDGFHSGAYVVTTPDYAWEIAKVRADLAALTHEDKT